MRNHLSIGAIALAALTCGGFLGVANATQERATFGSMVVQAQPPVSTRRSVNLTEENRHTLREIILKGTKIDKAPDNISVTIGETVAQGVTLQPFPDDVTRKVPQLKTHSFFVKGEEIVIVDPKDNTVADIVK